MRESIGYTVTINIIIVFLVLTFAFILGTFAYSKAFRANSKIINSIEKNEGYNDLSKSSIEIDLKNLGYVNGDSSSCSETRISNNYKGYLVQNSNSSEKFEYCIYRFQSTSDKDYYNYGVITYMTFDIVFFNKSLKIPVYGKTRYIYKF